MSPLGRLESALLALLAAVASMGLNGYRFGESNHGITVPILKHLMDPALYPGDVLVATAPRFATVTYWLLARVLPGPEAVPAAFFVLHLLAAAALFAGIYRIGAWLAGPAVGLASVAALMPVRIGLAGAYVHRAHFTHTHLAAALCVWALALFLEGRRVLPMLLLGLGAYNHALLSGYLLVPLGLVVLAEWKEAGTRRTLAVLAAAALPLLPLLAWIALRGEPLTAQWLSLLRQRSAHHSFPGTWGADVPAAAFLLVLALLASTRLAEPVRRMLALLFAGIALQFVLGTVFTEWVPLKPVLQYQPHRSWTFALLLCSVLVASLAVEGFRAGGFARAAAVATAAVVFVPGLEPWLPAVVLLQCVLVPAPPWARGAAAAAVVLFAPWMEHEPDYGYLPGLWGRVVDGPLLGACALAVLVWLAAVRAARRSTAVAAVLVVAAWLRFDVFEHFSRRWEAGAWRRVQVWARENTPRDAVFLTPPEQTGFRVFSERTIVGEWKDGTQQYFDEGFAREWDARMGELDPQRFPGLPSPRILELARRYGASYVVLPRPPGRRDLALVFRTPGFDVYRVP